MLIITGTQDVPIDSTLGGLIDLRRSQLGGTGDLSDVASFIVAEQHDTIRTLEAAIGFALDDEAPFEWVLHHRGWFEATTILSDDGYALVLWVPDDPSTDADLLALLRDHAAIPTARQTMP